ncbi:unnamed protein product [Rotaria sordida]|uniref:Uncharacterized protein n=1 Tax=Rotaria sordida TaxID=392033 RepID=A0A819SGX5_9BILA|nr:unnamed protein product [Rotaria sordida]
MVGFDAKNRDTINPLNISSEIFNLTVTLDEYKQEECTKIDVLSTLKEYGCFDSFNSYNNKCNDDTQRLSSESIRLQSSIEYDVKSNQEKLQQDVASSKPNIDDIPYVSYNETLIWKITSFHGKKIMIDFGNIPERIFTYVLSLNPRSTMHIQQMLIKQEAQGEVLQQPHEIDIDEYGISCEETRRDENVTNNH